LGAALSSSKIMRRYAFCAPSLQFWQLTNAKRTVRASFGASAVRVRPSRLPSPLASTKRYQYSRAGFRPPTNTRQVQSDSADIVVLARVTTCLKAWSSATSTVTAGAGRAAVAGQRVQRITLSGCGSPEATPSGKRARVSVHAADRSEREPPHAYVAPIAAAEAIIWRRVSFNGVLEGSRLIG
jgi:hypothetical protein